MVGRKSTVELPEGWIESINTTNGRKIKIYTNEVTGKKLYSKTEVMRYVNRSSVTQESPQQPSQHSTPQQPVQWSSPQQQTPQQLVQWSTLQQPNQQTTPQEPSQQEKLSTEDEANKKIVSTNEILDWLPSGWRMEVKSYKSGAHKGRDYKSYVDPSTGRKFYSKPEVLQHLKSVEHGDMTFDRKKRKRGPKSSSSVNPYEPVDGSPSKQKPDDSISKELKTADATPAELTERTDASLDKANPTPGWLPSGWKVVLKTKKTGKQYKYFIDPTTGFKFYSKPEVLMFLNGGKRVAWSRKKNNVSHRKPTKKCDVKQVARDKFAEEHKAPPSQVIIERGTPDKLPSGWIKEIKIQKQGNNIRKDPYYTDPVSGYVFRSQTDALRYLETGDIYICAIRPKKRDELDWLSGDINHHVNQVAGDKSAEELKSPPCEETTNSKRLAQKTETFVKNLERNIVVERGTPDKLPSGWIKEIKIQTKGKNIRKDPYYTDPVSGYVFRSQTDALRYLETGDINMCAIRPKKRDEFDQVAEDKSAEELKSTPCQETKNSKRLAQKSETFVNNLGRNIVVERGTPDKLPSGWIKEIKIQTKGKNIRKDPYYTDPASGYVFRSQTDALRYLETGDINMCAIRPKKRDEFDQLAENKSAEELKSPPCQETKNSKRLAQKSETFVNNLGKNIAIEQGTPDKLPSGWIKEIKIQTKGKNIRKDPYYTDPVSGYVFRSQTDALRYLETGDINMCAIRPKKRDEFDQVAEDKSAEELKSPPCQEIKNSKRLAQKPETFVNNLERNIIVERGTPDKLPSGWIKEIKIQTNGNNIRKDPYYTDPASGYVFRSQTDALRYLETGDINICAIRPKKRDEFAWLSGDINSSSAADIQKLQVQDNKRKLFEGNLETKSNDLSTKRKLQLRSSKNNDETSEGNLEEESTKKDPHPKSMASASKESKAVNDENGEKKLPVLDGKRPRGRKKAYTGTMKRKTNLPCRSSKRLLGFKIGTIEKGKGEPVQTEPKTNTVKPSLAETLNEALGIEEEDIRGDAAVENNPDPNPPRKETINKRVKENNQQQQQEVDLYHQLGGSSSSSPWTEIIKEPETTWLMNPPSLNFSFKTVSSNADEQGPIVQDYFQQETSAANKKADLGAPGFTSFNFFQGNVAAPGPAPPSAGPYNFLQTSSQSPPANSLFYSGIMPAHQSSPQNLMFPPDNTQNHQSPAHPMFPHGGFGFGFGFQ